MTCRCLAVALLLAGVDCAFGQMLDVKPGLWESKSTDEAGSITKTRECMTPEEFAKQLSKLKNNPSCKVNTSSVTAKQMILDVVCEIAGSQVKMRGEMNALDREHVTATIHSSLTTNGHEQTSTVNGDAHFVNASCGDLKSGEPEIIQ